MENRDSPLNGRMYVFRHQRIVDPAGELEIHAGFG